MSEAAATATPPATRLPTWPQVWPAVAGVAAVFATLAVSGLVLAKPQAEAAVAPVAAAVAENAARLDALADRVDRLESRIGERLDRARDDRAAMEARLLAAIRERGEPAPEKR